MLVGGVGDGIAVVTVVFGVRVVVLVLWVVVFGLWVVVGAVVMFAPVAI